VVVPLASLADGHQAEHWCTLQHNLGEVPETPRRSSSSAAAATAAGGGGDGGGSDETRPPPPPPPPRLLLRTHFFQRAEEAQSAAPALYQQLVAYHSDLRQEEAAAAGQLTVGVVAGRGLGRGGAGNDAPCPPLTSHGASITLAGRLVQGRARPRTASWWSSTEAARPKRCAAAT
jgi:hypothetical protein